MCVGRRAHRTLFLNRNAALPRSPALEGSAEPPPLHTAHRIFTGGRGPPARLPRRTGLVAGQGHTVAVCSSFQIGRVEGEDQ